MAPSDALAKIIEAGKTGRFSMTIHARQEAIDASATRYDVQNALRTASCVLHQPFNDRWRVDGGTDLDGDELVVVVVFEGDVIVITVF